MSFSSYRLASKRGDVRLKKITDFLSSDKAKKIIIIAGMAVILLLFLSTLSFGEKTEQSPAAAAESAGDIERELEQRLEKLISQIDGVGGVTVMVTLENTTTRVFAEETQSEVTYSDSEGTSSKSSSGSTEIVLAGSAKEPLETGRICPKVRGVAVVCPGAADPVVREKIANTVSGVLNVGISRVSVTY